VIFMYRIAVIGDRDSILGFKALGVEIFPVATAEQAARALRNAGEEGYAIIFVTEPLLAEIESEIDALNREVLPAVIPIPNNKGATGVAMERMRRTVEQAVGVDILSQKEGDK